MRPETQPTRKWRRSRGLIRDAAVLAFVLLPLSSCETASTAPEDKRIGPEGGTAQLEEGTIRMVVPAGAVSEAVWFTALNTQTFPSSPRLVPGTTWELGPVGTVFSRPVTVTVQYDPGRLPGDVAEEELALYRVDNDGWSLLEYASVDPGGNTVSGGTLALGRFGVMGMALTGVSIDPTTLTLEPGASAQLVALPQGENDRVLPGRTVVWSSSDTAIAQVGAGGLVRGAGEGTATITASAGNYSATASVDVRIPVGSVAIDPVTGWVGVGGTLQMNATVRDRAGDPLEGRAVTWSSRNIAAVTIDSNGVARGVSMGSAIVTATSDGVQGMATVTVHGGLGISTTSLAGGVVGALYSQTLAASGGNGTYQWSLLDGSLPDGLTLDGAGGVITGAPTASGEYTFAVQVASAGMTAERTLTITVAPAAVASVDITPPTVILAAGDTARFSAVARDAAGSILTGRTTVWSSSDEEVVTVSADGLATARAQGSATISVKIDGFPAWASISVLNALTITDSILHDGVAGQSYADSLTASGGDGRVIWRIVQGDLPAGLALGDSTGLVTGTPIRVDSTVLTVAVTSGDGQADTASVRIQIWAPLTVSADALSPGTEGSPFADTLTASGGKKPYTWRVSAGALPAGLGLNSSTGVLLGTPSAAGTYSFGVEVSSADGQSDARGLTFEVAARPVTSITVDPVSAGITAGGTQQFTATPRDGGGNALSGRSITWSSGTPGIATVNGSGLVTAVGVGTTLITATCEGISGSAIVTVHGALAITTGALTAGSVGGAYSQTLAATGGDGVYTWTVSAGALPGGLSLDGDTGTIGGVPAGAGSYDFTIQVTSGDGQSATKALTIIVS